MAAIPSNVPYMNNPQMPPGTVPPAPPNPGAAAQPPGGLPMPPPQGAQGAANPNGLDPALIEAVMKLQGQAPQQAQIQRQMRLADQLRASAPGMMESKSPINTPNWAGTLAGMAAMYKANKNEEDAQNKDIDLGNERGGIYKQFFNAMGGGGTS